ncbi:hypothetical protein BT93_I0149 [Corymbia citriodora subsp. variegata]|nr:hypothetical protein BT93_I0149 [Corymbia citriodora subsp. variegata]
MIFFHKRPPTTPTAPRLWLFLLMSLLFLWHCHGSSRSTNVFKVNGDHPKSQSIGHFSGYLPRGLPIPASGPSRKHNDIGLQSSRSSP